MNNCSLIGHSQQSLRGSTHVSGSCFRKLESKQNKKENPNPNPPNSSHTFFFLSQF